MKTKSATEGSRFHRNRARCVSQTQDAQQAFAVFSVTPCAGPPEPGTVRAACEDIPGVNALRVDGVRGKIHVLYDGSTSVIEQVASVLRKLGLNLCHPAGGPSSMRHAYAGKDECA